MKSMTIKNTLVMLLLAPVFIQGVCSKDDADKATPTADQLVTWKIAGTAGSLAVPVDSISQFVQGTSTYVYGMTKPSPVTAFGVAFDGKTTGAYPAKYFGVLTNGKYYVPASVPVQVIVSEYGTLGQYISGTYTGNVKDSLTSAVVAVSGTFKVKIN